MISHLHLQEQQPVDSLCATFDEIYNGFKNITAGLPENEIHCLFHDNAIKYYNPL